MYYSGTERWRKRLALLLLIQRYKASNVGLLSQDADKPWFVNLHMGHFRVRPPFSVDYNPTFDIADKANSLDRVLRKLIAAHLSQKIPVLYGSRKFSILSLTEPYSQLV
jgi:hypothetical protein